MKDFMCLQMFCYMFRTGKSHSYAGSGKYCLFVVVVVFR